MSIAEQILELTNKVEALNDKINLIDGTVQFNLTLHWSIIIGVITIAGVALYFISKSIIQTGIDKGINKILDNNKLKLDKNNPEIIGSLKLSNSQDDNTNIRLVKLENEPVINIETDKNNAAFKLNHKEIITAASYDFVPTLVNGWQGKANILVTEYGKNKLIDISYEDLNYGLGNHNIISILPKGYAPRMEIKFKGYNAEDYDVIFTINTNGEITVNGLGRQLINVNAHIVFIV